MFGSEGAGLSDAAIQISDVKISVPQSGMTQSLNVAACAALVLGEVLRLRSLPSAEDGDAPRLLNEAEQRDLEERLLPLRDEGLPLRMHNKAAAKAAWVSAKG